MSKYPKYSLVWSEADEYVYQFASVGKKGVFIKSVIFSGIDAYNLYNLAFGDVNTASGEISDEARTDNGDRNKVLATIESAVAHFFERHPDAQIYFEGSTAARTRLYRMAITSEYEALTLKYRIFGIDENESEQTFRPGERYKAFVVLKR